MKRYQLLPMFVLAAWLVLAIGAGLLPIDPDHISLEQILHGPAMSAWLGYDDLGRSVSDRLIMGARTSLMVAAVVVSLSFIVGTMIGVLAAWFGGWVDYLLVMVIDIFMAFPGILLAIALAGLLGPGIMNAVMALVFVGWVGFARLARSQSLSIARRDHIQAATALGTTDTRIMVWHILPLILSPLLIEATFAIAGTVIAEASLSFLGLGVQPPQASWGSMIREGTRYMLISPHLVLAPGAAIFLVVMSINLIGDNLRDTMDVRLNHTGN